MSAALAVATRIASLVTVQVLVGTRVYQGILPQSLTLPAVRVQRISEDAIQHLRGGVDLIRTRVQVDSVSDSADAVGESHAVDAAIVGDQSGSALLGWRGVAAGITVTDVQPAGLVERFDPDELQQYRVMRDVIVSWKG